MIGIFVVDTPVSENVPEAEALHYEQDGETRGGWSLIGAADLSPTNLVAIDAADEAALNAIETEDCVLWQIL